MEQKNEELELALKELEELVYKFADLQKITKLSKQGKIKLTEEEFKKIEEKYIKIAKKIENLNKKLKLLKNN